MVFLGMRNSGQPLFHAWKGVKRLPNQTASIFLLTKQSYAVSFRNYRCRADIATVSLTNDYKSAAQAKKDNVVPIS